MTDATLNEIRSLLQGLGSHVTQLGANVEDLRARQLEHGKKLDAISSVAQEARAGVVILHADIAALSETATRLESACNAISGDLQGLRASVMQQVSHDAERRANLSKSVEKLEEAFDERERATGGA